MGRARRAGQGHLWSTRPFATTEWDKRDLLAFEREMLGLYVSDHPLLRAGTRPRQGRRPRIASLSEEGAVPDGAIVTLAGMLTGVQRRITKQGKAWASASLEDLAGGVETLFFPNTYELVGQYIAEDAIVVVKGRVDRRDDTPKIMAMDLSMPDLTNAAGARPVVLTVPVGRVTPQLVDRLKEIINQHPGDAEVQVHLTNGPKVMGYRLGPRFRVVPDTALSADFKALLGAAAVTI